MEPTHILLVEDEPFLAKVVKDSLEQRQYRVTHAADGRIAYDLFQQHSFSLCIVDIMLPHTDGFTLVQQIRTLNQTIPVLFLTARTATKDSIEGYQSGGNDYLKKPFSLDELFLRVNELLKRFGKDNVPALLPIGGYQFNPQNKRFQFLNQEVIRLSYRETQLLHVLYDHKNDILDRKQVLLALWGDDSFFHARTMDVFITKLRKHLKQDHTVEIINVRGVGYKLIC